MKNFQYNFALLKKTREDKQMSKLEMAHHLCLSLNQLESIEENSFRYFPSESIKFAAVKKYALALNLNLDQVVLNKEDEVAPLNLPAVVSPLLSKEKIKIKKGTYRNKANELRKAWQDLLLRLLKN
ncbi:helix-turn-helix domain-containing protein [Candidatus Methylopumilus universalis]|uniref:Helix-turn-helix domain-containing protein n=1 Tax=Candidatus Methylopumilus universalis TaxID=2588536 RepID=A0ABX5VTB2_9PROT|nr:helix-turn-helix domain-containing protein [Candidatus Methylopumilus universalis]QDC51099.1 helix-turn-helix domain-containing protein [Candidatus Methylopumilus universalis]QDC61236.1 helix-turn-helix domain-containing protein [Candidatus Methylopumilus universalis]